MGSDMAVQQEGNKRFQAQTVCYLQAGGGSAGRGAHVGHQETQSRRTAMAGRRHKGLSPSTVAKGEAGGRSHLIPPQNPGGHEKPLSEPPPPRKQLRAGSSPQASKIDPGVWEDHKTFCKPHTQPQLQPCPVGRVDVGEVSRAPGRASPQPGWRAQTEDSGKSLAQDVGCPSKDIRSPLGI